MISIIYELLVTIKVINIPYEYLDDIVFFYIISVKTFTQKETWKKS